MPEEGIILGKLVGRKKARTGWHLFRLPRGRGGVGTLLLWHGQECAARPRGQ